MLVLNNFTALNFDYGCMLAMKDREFFNDERWVTTTIDKEEIKKLIKYLKQSLKD